MANGKHISQDEIQYIVDVESSKAQQEIHKLEKASVLCEQRTRNDRIAKFKRRNLALYNRVVWGVLYHETFPELRSGFTNEVRQGIRKMLENSFNPK